MEDIWFNITNLLYVKEVVYCMRVCKMLNKICKSDILWKRLWKQIFLNNYYLRNNTIEYNDGYPMKLKIKTNYYENCKIAYKLIKLQKTIRTGRTIDQLYSCKELCMCEYNFKTLPIELDLLDNLQVLCLNETQLKSPINPNNFRNLITRFSKNTYHNPLVGCTGNYTDIMKNKNKHKLQLNFNTK